jgi:pimeloyl-ACP methyl ester carboxylesterase
MRRILALILFLAIAALLTGCATAPSTQPPVSAAAPPKISLSREMENRILAMNPEHVTEREVKQLLAPGPAPRIVNIHGGIYPVYLAMESFSEFLMGMGYPETSIRNPGDGSYSFSCYESSEKIAGAIAWYYEQEGMRPLVVGHSQGGMQAVKVLHDLAGHSSAKIAVWNPLTGKKESRYEITEPLTGKPAPVVGLQLPYASAVGAGGFTRFLPNQWSMMTKLRKVPDSVEEFTGFYMGLDLFGGDLLGFGSANQYEPNGAARVRNVRLPTGYNHVTVPSTKHLLKSRQITEWINNYTPTDEPKAEVEFDSDSSHILWAADVWHSIKKHWVLELQRVIRAQRAQTHAS